MIINKNFYFTQPASLNQSQNNAQILYFINNLELFTSTKNSNTNTNSWNSNPNTENSLLDILSKFILHFNNLQKENITNCTTSTTNSPTKTTVNKETEKNWQTKLDEAYAKAAECNYDYSTLYKNGLPPYDSIINELTIGVTNYNERKEIAEAALGYAKLIADKITNSPWQKQEQLQTAYREIYQKKLNLGLNEQDANEAANKEFKEKYPITSQLYR